MALKDILKFLHKNYFDILSMAVFFGILGIVIYFLFPAKYVASGTFFVGRNIDVSEPHPNNGYFSYEGYYAQQNALSYSANIEGIINSDYTRAEVLKLTGTPVNSYNLRELDKKIKVKRTAPQVIDLQVKDTNPQKSVELWQALTDITANINTGLSSQADPNIFVKTIGETPVVKETYKNPYINFGGGLISGALLAVFVLAFEEYWKTYKSEIVVNPLNTPKAKKKK